MFPTHSRGQRPQDARGSQRAARQQLTAKRSAGGWLARTVRSVGLYLLADFWVAEQRASWRAHPGQAAGSLRPHEL